MEDLEDAIQLSRRAVEITPVDHPDLCIKADQLRPPFSILGLFWEARSFEAISSSLELF
jgi:hypothetical protein